MSITILTGKIIKHYFSGIADIELTKIPLVDNVCIYNK